jgi:hypothetical protein
VIANLNPSNRELTMNGAFDNAIDGSAPALEPSNSNQQDNQMDNNIGPRRFELDWIHDCVAWRATSLAEMADLFQKEADVLRALAAAGVELDVDLSEMDNGYACLTTDDPDVARRFEFGELVCDEFGDCDLVEEWWK